jgi:hypothetical protein
MPVISNPCELTSLQLINLTAIAEAKIIPGFKADELAVLYRCETELNRREYEDG